MYEYASGNDLFNFKTNYVLLKAKTFLFHSVHTQCDRQYKEHKIKRIGYHYK